MQTVPAAQIAREVLTIIPLLNRIIAQELGDDATVVQMRVLSLLSESPLTLSALARNRRISMQAASEHVQGLVDRGWVVRVPDEKDRRQALLSTTEEGLRQLEQARQQVVNRLSPALARLSGKQSQTIHEVCSCCGKFWSRTSPLMNLPPSPANIARSIQGTP
jgi:DNA-binding MarR family transcriptional regulator